MSDAYTARCASPVEPHTRVCLHLFNQWLELKAKITFPYHFRFVAGSPKYELVCENCGSSGSVATRSLCHDCCDTVISNTTLRRADIGPKVIEKDVGLMAELREKDATEKDARHTVLEAVSPLLTASMPSSQFNRHRLFLKPHGYR